MGKEHRNRSFRPLLASGLACLVGTAVVGQTAPPYKSAKPLSKFTYTLQYLGEYESNIYHVFDESSRTNGMLNVLDAAVDWKYKANRRVTHRASVYAGAGVYMPTTYNDRNTYDFGIKYEPDFRPSRKVTISPLLDISRRSKNVIDDISPDPTRTLTKSQFDGSLVTRFDVGKGRLDIGGGYTVNNYDESDTVILGNPQPLTSWDYNEWHFIGEFRQPFGTKVNGRVEYSLEKRTYRERYRFAGGQRRFTYSTIVGHHKRNFV
ncbi:MAG: hypothetical protein HY851_09100, partial [candidate division Zixibacteria bacterium]|nr:hypothetical protein [candidate division Zixibacteria bacterium]